MNPNGEPMGTLQGVAQDGLLNNAVITVYAWNGSKGAVLTAGRTDFQGRYSVSLRAASQPVLSPKLKIDSVARAGSDIPSGNKSAALLPVDINTTKSKGQQ